ncbi:response regulator [Pararhizobium sp. DWP3-4]|uniref:response regulator n=1 Tax=Pararhizobium sp. DWP3-4 TaxID=2804565 RepID=UPI003CF97C45
MRGLSRVVLADDHAIVREGLKMLLSTIEGIAVVGEAADGDTVERLLKEIKTDLLILDLGMPGVGGFQFIRTIRTRRPGLKILIMTANLEPRSVRAALDAGADGYLTKSGDASELMAAIEAMRHDEPYVAEEVRFAVDQKNRPAVPPGQGTAIGFPAELTRREQQMLALIPHGVTTRDIAERLGISPLTARKHRENLMRKLDLHSGAELTAYAIRLGLAAG